MEQLQRKKIVEQGDQRYHILTSQQKEDAQKVITMFLSGRIKKERRDNAKAIFSDNHGLLAIQKETNALIIKAEANTELGKGYLLVTEKEDNKIIAEVQLEPQILVTGIPIANSLEARNKALELVQRYLPILPASRPIQPRRIPNVGKVPMKRKN